MGPELAGTTSKVVVEEQAMSLALVTLTTV